MDKLTKYKNVFKWIFFSLLIIVSSTPLIALIMQWISSESLITDKIYGLNGFLCIISAFAVVAYWIGVYFLKSEDSYGTYKHKKIKKKIDIKPYIKKAWPCILLVIFMGWTAIGCIQASMEAAAEAALRDDIEENDTERNKEIAAWTEGDRMPNAADRAWNGCNNLKDGYFSFLFYAMVAVNVIMLGANSDNLKKWILRVFLITSSILVFFSFLSFIDITFLNGMVKYNRAIFNNSNHYGYYLCISTVLAAMMFIKEKNIYFKSMALLGFILMTFMLIINNTFGAYLGVLTAIIIITLVAIIKLIIDLIMKNKINVTEILKVVSIVGIFAIFSSTVAGAEVLATKSTKKTPLIYSTVYLKVGENNYDIYYNKKSGFELEESEKQRNSKVQSNFEQLAKDVSIILDFFKKDEKIYNELEYVGIPTEETTNTESTDNKSGLTEEVSKTGSGRGEVWIKSLDLIKQRPLFGWGLENMLNEFYQQYGINEGRTHNLILQLAGTTGIVGMLLYMVAVIVIFFKVLFNYKNWGLIEYVTVPVFIAYMVSSMFGNSAFYTSPYFMIILGMMIASMLFCKNRDGDTLEKENKVTEKLIEESSITEKEILSKSERKLNRRYKELTILAIILLVSCVLSMVVHFNLFQIFSCTILIIVLFGMIMGNLKKDKNALKFGYALLILEILGVIITILLYLFRVPVESGVSVIDIILIICLSSDLADIRKLEKMESKKDTLERRGKNE